MDILASIAKAAADHSRDSSIFKIPKLLSGAATFAALKDAVDEIIIAAPQDHDVIIQAFNISVEGVRFLEPHTLILSGFDQSGHRTAVVVHYSQMVAHVIYVPQRGPERVITGFKVDHSQQDNEPSDA